MAAYNHAEIDLDTLPPNGSCSGQEHEEGATCGIRHFSVEGSDLVYSLVFYRTTDKQKRKIICFYTQCIGLLFLYLIHWTKSLVINLHQRKEKCQEAM